ncbi:lipopolysaccharide export system permease protein [Sphingobium sp. B2D3A]|uniref:LptF/LptG family permease n=1 Tax=unclassified Sphingobium TaxID=2611147 RepID=UPI002223F6F9|nr:MULTISPECIES: LptF/LptG family permease [unclassified Sphingobium]MCW2336220.1 lipopolysaccharide export system permease protein [Sphingobium sp. B2D3A]MCW2385975.1 lipopolysaccharide export system permease protein [Sphingobium sp. B2D3D]
MLTALDRYMARLIAVPLFASLIVAAMLLVLDRMQRLFVFVATEGGPVSVVWRMLANLLPEYLGLGIPIGLMLGILLAFRKLALSSELDILRGVGLSYTRLLKVPYMYAIALAILNLTIVGFIQPDSKYAYERLRFELRSGALGASIKVGEFTKLGDGITIRIEESEDEGKKLSGIFARMDSDGGQSLAVTAARGQFLATDDPDTIIMRLTDGVLVHNSPSFTEPRILSFSNHDLPISLPKIEEFRMRGDGDVELSLPELFRAGLSRDTALGRAQAWSNFNFRVVEVAMMMLLPLAAIAFAIPPKRSTSALGVFLSIVFIVTYHKINQTMQSLGALGRIDPFLGLWGPFLIFAGIIAWLYYQTAYVPGGQPIGALDRQFAKLLGLFKSLLKWFGDRRYRKAHRG